MKRATRERMQADVRTGIRTGGYPKKLTDGRWALMGYKKGKNHLLGVGRQIGCTKIRPGTPGAWIAGQRCSYQFNIRGRWYACRGYGEGMAASCRLTKRKPPSGFDGARRRG